MLTWLLILILLYVAMLLVYILFQEKFLLRNEKLPADFIFQCDQPFEEIDLSTPDSGVINLVHVRTNEPKGLIIYFHGNSKHIQNYLPYTAKFSYLGFDVLMMDYRSFGKSSGVFTEKNFYADAGIVYDYAQEKFPALKKIIYGRSMGTAAASHLASVKDCSLLILEAPFYNVYDLMRRFGFLLPDGYYLKFSLRNDEHLKHVKSRWLILHGTNDKVVPHQSGKKLCVFKKEGDQFVSVLKGNHNNLEQFSEYSLALQEALETE